MAGESAGVHNEIEFEDTTMVNIVEFEYFARVIAMGIGTCDNENGEHLNKRQRSATTTSIYD